MPSADAALVGDLDHGGLAGSAERGEGWIARQKGGRVRAADPPQETPERSLYLTTSNARIMSFSSCSRMWQW